jgi:pimeloyl-ACP methyl ester carboxylesterase
MDHWIHTVPALRRRAAVLAYDQPGLGKSDDFADAKQSLERSVGIALAVLDDSGWTEPVDVIGQSHGGLIAIGLSARAPERVRSMVLLGTGGTPTHPMYRFFRLPGLDRVLLALGQALSWAAGHDGEDGRVSRPGPAVGGSERARAPGPRAWLERALAAAIRAGAFSSFSPDPVPSSVVAEGLRASPMTLRTMVRLAHDSPCDKVAAYARRVKSPVLFIHGREDRLVNVSYARRLFDVMREAGRKARFVELDGGHMLHFSRPLTANPLLEDWLAP